MKVIKYGIVLIAIFILSGCNGIKPEIMKKNISINIPNDEIKKHPVILFFQGSGGNNSRANKWASWFEQYGIASVIIDNAGVRGLNKLYGVNYGSDLAPTLSALKDNLELDLSRYAVMGFSRGGTAALESASSLEKNQTSPDFVFSLYPGDSKGCPNSHNDTTKVHVFYGDLDDWGKYKNIIGSCKSMASGNDNTTFHLLKNAHHGYDGDWDGGFNCCSGNYFQIEANEEALINTQKIILKAIQRKWNIKKR